MELALAQETVARWQFGITTVYHFLFVPITISLAFLIAGLQTAWVRTGKDKYFKATRLNAPYRLGTTTTGQCER